MSSKRNKPQALAPDDTPAMQDTAGPLLPETVAPVPGERETRIREAAYRRYQQRAGGNGDALADWLEAEKEEDARKDAQR